MNINSNELKSQLLNRIQQEAASGNMNEVSRLSSLVTRLQKVMVSESEIQVELLKLREQIVPPVSAQPIPFPKEVDESARKGRRPVSCLEITLDWRANGHAMESEVIKDPIAAESLVQLVRRLSQVFGNRVFEVGATMNQGRRAFISANPERDYVNPTNGDHYSFHNIPGTSYSIFTNTSTEQKAEDVRTLLTKLGMPPQSFVIKIVPRAA